MFSFVFRCSYFAIKAIKKKACFRTARRNKQKIESYKAAIAQYGLMRLEGGGARLGGVMAISR